MGRALHTAFPARPKSLLFFYADWYTRDWAPLKAKCTIRSDWSRQKLTIGGFFIVLTVLTNELIIRYPIRAWPFEPVLYVPQYLTTRDIPLRWRFSPSGRRNS
jgi:hypothetical protein